MMNRLTTCLHGTSSFFQRLARLFDFTGSLNSYKYSDFPKRSNSPHESDINAIASDWIAFGGDLRRSIERYQEQENITLDDSIIQEARNQLMQDKTMQELVELRKNSIRSRQSK
jgi:hypothetical protein